MKFCPNCGERLVAGDLFCQQCGTKLDQFEVATPAAVVPLVKTPEPITAPAPASTTNTNSKKKSNNAALFLILFLILGGGAAAWYFYVYKPGKENPISAVLPETKPPVAANTDTATAVIPATADTQVDTPVITAPTTATIPIKPVATVPVKTEKKADQKIKEKEIVSKPSPQKQVIQETPIAKPIVTAPVSRAYVIYSNWNNAGNLLNNPFLGKNKLNISKPTMITRITTYHWFDGKGDNSGGSITIKGDEDFGPFMAKRFLRADDGTPNAKWIFEPNRILPAGKYKVNMSNEKTWSYNIESKGRGFIIIEGYEIN